MLHRSYDVLVASFGSWDRNFLSEQSEIPLVFDSFDSFGSGDAADTHSCTHTAIMENAVRERSGLSRSERFVTELFE